MTFINTLLQRGEKKKEERILAQYMSEIPEHKFGLDTLPEINDFLALLDSCFLQPRALALPTQYSFAVSVLCDLKCPYCPRQTYGEIIESGLMSIKKFRTLAEYFKFSRYTGLFGLGEPLLHPEFFGFVKTVKNVNGYAATSTHGMLLSEQVIAQLLDSGLDELEISIDAVNPEIFGFLRAGADIKTLIKNIQLLQTEKKRRGSRRPRVQIASVISVYNLREMPALVRLAKQLEVEKIVFTNMIITHPENKHVSVYPSGAFSRMLNRAQGLGKKLGIEVCFFYQKPYPWQRKIFSEISGATEAPMGYGCPLIWRSLYVELNGDVKPCCYFEEVFGNCFEESPERIFNNPQFRQLRQQLLSGDLPQSCVDCGNLVKITDAYLDQKLAEAEMRLHSLQSRITEKEFNQLKNLLAEFSSMAHNIVSK
ncbi:radical SAM protein [Candidatus Sumerlaeota bacterium]|nr:radical SAM protein [Candidatus Sumerlaeota bacterium]